MAGLSAIGCRLRATFVNEAGNMANQTHNQHHGHGQQKKKKLSVAGRWLRFFSQLLLLLW